MMGFEQLDYTSLKIPWKCEGAGGRMQGAGGRGSLRFQGALAAELCKGVHSRKFYGEFGG